jgi:hypothetical protein
MVFTSSPPTIGNASGATFAQASNSGAHHTAVFDNCDISFAQMFLGPVKDRTRGFRLPIDRAR